MADGLIAQGALAHLFDQVLPQDMDTLLSFFEYNSIRDIDDFILLSDVNFDESYCTIADPTTYQRLSPILIKN